MSDLKYQEYTHWTECFTNEVGVETMFWCNSFLFSDKADKAELFVMVNVWLHVALTNVL